MFDDARRIAGNNDTFSRYIDEQQNEHLRKAEAADELVKRGGQASIQVRGAAAAPASSNTRRCAKPDRVLTPSRAPILDM